MIPTWTASTNCCSWGWSFCREAFLLISPLQKALMFHYSHHSPIPLIGTMCVNNILLRFPPFDCTVLWLLYDPPHMKPHHALHSVRPSVRPSTDRAVYSFYGYGATGNFEMQHELHDISFISPVWLLYSFDIDYFLSCYESSC